MGSRRSKKSSSRVPPPPPLSPPPSSVESLSSSPLECPVCFSVSSSFSVGLCNHSICQECSVRMRVLLEAEECPICRTQLPQVYHSLSQVPFPKSSALTEFLDKKSGIRFENEEVRERFRSLIKHVCPKCPKSPEAEFPSFQELETHVRREHEVFYCNLCSTHLKLFTHERRLYTRPGLAVHRRKGDKTDKSHKGHPNCKFCETRFMDNEALFLHLRKEHYFCHFCDADGRHNDYYPNYGALREHFGEEHYLCTEGSCIDSQFTHAFKTDIDIKAHRAEVHGNAFSKYDARANRTVDFDRNYKARSGGGSKRNPRESEPPVFEEPIQHHQAIPDVYSVENFPTLGGGGSGSSLRGASALPSKKQQQSRGGAKWNKKNGGRVGEEEFPSLGGSGRERPTTAPARQNGGKNVAQRIRESENHWGPDLSPTPPPPGGASRAPNNPPPTEDFPGLDLPSRKKKEMKKDERLHNTTTPLGASSLQSVANVISTTSSNASNSSSWSVVSKKPPPKKIPGKQGEGIVGGGGGIPGLKYAPPGAAKPRAEEAPGHKGSSAVDDFPSLGPSTNKISAHFQPNSHDPVPSNWDSLSSPELFLPTEASGAKPKSSSQPQTTKKKQNPKQSLLSNNNSVYNPPKDFALRNKKLLSLIMQILGGKSLEFKEFMNISKKFRDESLSSSQFYDKCLAVVGNNNKLMEFLPELIFLLPDIKKQKELLLVHGRKNSFLKIVNLKECDKCNQILSSKDFSEHVITHSLDSDFPSLYAS